MIPVIDLSEYKKDKSKLADDLGKAFHDFGFVRVKGHGIPETILNNAETNAKAFFGLPDAVKQTHHVDALTGIMSYSKNSETARGQTTPDMKEEWCIRTRLPNDHPMAGQTGKIMTVPEVPRFKKSISDLFNAFEDASRRVMNPLSLYMGEQENWFDDKFDKSHSTMRLLHYPSGGNAANHLDLNFLTWLRATEPGLYVTARDGTEYAINAEPGELILNGGMQLGLLTNNDLKPSWHRVEANNPRDTIVFFVHPNPDVELKPLDKFAQNPPHNKPDYFPPADQSGSFSISVKDFVQQEVDKIYAPEAAKTKNTPAPRR